MSSFRRRHRSPFDLLLCTGGSSIVSMVLEEEEDDEDDDDTENDVSQSHYSQTSSTNNSILSTPVRTTRDKVPQHQDLLPVDMNRCVDLSPPPPPRVTSPTSVSSPSATAVDVYQDEPPSPVEWYYNHHHNEYDMHQSISPLHYYLNDNDVDAVEPPPPPPPPLFAPSFFTTTTPWMCVFDLDAACGSDSTDHTTTPLDTATEQYRAQHSTVDAPMSPPSIRTKQHQQQHEHWNDLLPSVMNFSQWFTDGTSCDTPSDCSGTAVYAQSPSSPTEMDQENEIDDPKSLSNFIQLPLSPTSVRHPIDTPDDYPLISTQLFTNYATNSDVETIYFAHSPPLQQQSMVDDVISGAEMKGSNTRRRAPTAQASMSLTPAAAAQLTKKVTSSTTGKHHEHHYHGRSEDFRVQSDVMEIVQVKTPGADRSALKELPSLRDAPPAKREELFVLKLQLCSVIFSFDDPTADKRGKDMKRQTLLELVDYVNTPAGQKIFTESIMGDLMAMVSANVCRALPPVTDDFDPEEDEPVLEPAWPHLQVAYEFFLRFIVSSEVNAKAAKKYVDQKFCLQLVELFDSEDPRERDYLKTILHRIYGKFMSHRSFIRRAISNVFYRFVYETERHNGIGELLEILGSIINGFAIPLKKEHLQFLVRALIPLHKPKCVALYHQQLSYCIIQYVEKDADTATPILNGFFKCWPWSCSGKQVMFLNELEEILELLGADQLAQVSNMLFTNLARCLDCDHFQVVERALFLWNNEHLVNSGCLSRLNAHTVLPIIYGPLYKNSSGHWNATVEGLAQNVLKMYMEYDLALYDKCTAAYFNDEEEAKKRLEALAEKWHAIEQEAYAMAPEIMAK